MTEPAIMQAEALADAICGCANREQHRRDVALIEAYREAAVAELRAEVERLRKAVREAEISLGAIGHPKPNDPPDAHICGVIARSCLVRINNTLSQKETSHED